jgi:hypothetical protein
MATDMSGQTSTKSGPENLPPPNISLEFAIFPEIHSLTEDSESPVLTITITSHATQPITIYTWATYLHLQRAMAHMVYHIVDVDTKQRVYRPIEHVQRQPARRRMGCPHETYFRTLYPEEPQVITQTFHLASLWRRRAELAGRISPKESTVYKGLEMRNFLEPGHRYTFGCPNAGIKWWRWGTKSENLEPVGAAPENCGMGWSEPRLAITDIKEGRVEIRK